MSHIIAANSKFADFRQALHGTFVFSYKLPEKLCFTEPHFARLLWIQPRPKTPVFILCDFVVNQSINGERLPFLGSSGNSQQGTVTAWVPLAANTVAATGLIRVVTHNKLELSDNTAYSLLIEIAPARHVIGTKRTSG